MPLDPMVLVLGDAGDWALAEVGKQLDSRGVRWALLNTADFPQRLDMDVRLEPDGSEWLGEFVADEVRVRLAEVGAVYYGKPTDFEFPAALSGPEQRFSRAQARTGVGPSGPTGTGGYTRPTGPGRGAGLPRNANCRSPQRSPTR